MQRARPGIQGDALGSAAIGCEFVLKLGNLSAQNEVTTLQHSGNGGVDFAFDTSILTLQIEVWNLNDHIRHSVTCSDAISLRNLSCVMGQRTRSRFAINVPGLIRLHRLNGSRL